MKYIYLLLIAIFLTACQPSTSKTYQTSEHEKIADKITSLTAQKIESETGLRLMGTGGGMMGKVRMMAMSFQYSGDITLQQARELLIYCLNEYLLAINSNEEIRPYLIYHPLNPEDIQIEIYIRSQSQEEQSIGALSLVGAVRGVLDYNIKQPDPMIYEKIHNESYEKAVKTLETEPLFNKIRRRKASI